jgi:hypothetical protein
MINFFIPFVQIKNMLFAKYPKLINQYSYTFFSSNCIRQNGGWLMWPSFMYTSFLIHLLFLFSQTSKSRLVVVSKSCFLSFLGLMKVHDRKNVGENQETQAKPQQIVTKTLLSCVQYLVP